MRTLAAACLLSLAPAPALGHDLWIEPEGDAFLLRYGHRGAEALPIDASKVRAIRCRSGDGAPRDVRDTATFSPKEVRIAARCAAVSAYLHGGFYSLTPDGERNLPRNRVENAVKAWESRQFAKWVDARAPGAGSPVGDELEIVPASDLSRARRGDKVAVRVLFQGKPVPGAVVAIDHRPLGESDSAGEVRVRIRSATVESIGATLRRPLSTPEADAQVLEATLSFEVAR